MQQRISFANCSFSSENLVRLALGELGSTTGGLQTVLLALLHARITSQETSLLQIAAKFGVGLAQGAGDTVTDSASLASEATAVYVNQNVITSHLGQGQGLTDGHLQRFIAEVVFDITIVDDDLAFTSNQTNAGHSGLAAANSVVFYLRPLFLLLSAS